MKLKLSMIMITMALLLTSCGVNKPSKTIDKLAGLDGDKEKIKKYYTAKTNALLEEIEKLAPIKDDMNNQNYNSFYKNAKWKVIDEKIDGDSAVVSIQFTDHVNPYLKGQTIHYKMKKEKVREGDSKINISIPDIAYTLQIGREAMEERLAILVSSIDELIEGLNQYLQDQENIENLFVGNVEKHIL